MNVIDGETSVSEGDLPDTLLSNRFVELPKQRWLQRWNWLSERTNPIVVKEARQSLNSKQFTICFSLTLIAVFLWTVFATVIQLPALYYIPGGMTMLGGFMVILTFPLLLVIPFSAFRSMVIESEERTFELVSISALSAQQIVNGKMLSAVLQTIIYLSTLTPCFVITYLLRGVLLSSILYYLIFTLLLSLALTAASLLIATIGRAKILQILASIFVLGGLLFISIFWSLFTVNTLQMWDMDGWEPIVVSGLIMLTATLIPVLLRAATAAIDFPSENHATSLRIRLSIFVFNFLAWGLWIALATESEGLCYFFLTAGLVMFLLIGSFVVAERGVISPRVQRTLPRTVLGKYIGIWYFPGAGLGYILLVGLFRAYCLAWIALALAAQIFQLGINQMEQIMVYSIACWLYFVFYTGLARLIMFLIPKSISGRMIIGFLVQVIAVMIGGLLPLFFASAINQFREPDYGWHQFLNLVWTLEQLQSSGIGMVAQSIVLLALFAFPIFGLNLILCGREVRLVRVHLPRRLQQEIQANQPAPLPIPDPFA